MELQSRNHKLFLFMLKKKLNKINLCDSPHLKNPGDPEAMTCDLM